MLVERKFNIVKVSRNKGIGSSIGTKQDKTVNYDGAKTLIKL